MDWDDLFPVFAIAAVASFVLSLKSFSMFARCGRNWPG